MEDQQRQEELEWIKGAQRGDSLAFERLVLRYQKLIFQLAYRYFQNEHDAQDAAQNAVIKIYQNLQKFSFRSSFSTWIYRVTSNVCLDLLRKNKNLPLAAEQAEDWQRSKDGLPEDELLRNDLAAQIRLAAKQLDAKYHEVLVLIDMEGLSYERTAQVLRVSVGTVKSRLNRARQKLRALLVQQHIL